MARHYYAVMNTANRMMLCTQWRSQYQRWHDAGDTNHYNFQVSVWTSEAKAKRAALCKADDLTEIVHIKVMND